jgi:hypothetical protein
MTKRFSKRANRGATTGLSGLADDLNRARFDLDSFRDVLRRSINDLARTRRWAPDQLKLAHAYAEWLTDSSGAEPRSLDGAVRRAVQEKFTYFCNEKHATSLPGQKQSWYQR